MCVLICHNSVVNQKANIYKGWMCVYSMNKEKLNLPKCPKCKSGYIYVLKDKSIQCRQCGYNSNENGEQDEKPNKDTTNE